MTTLIEQPFLFVDCQTTGATPVAAHLLEVGWTIGRACDEGAPVIETRLIALPEGEALPKRIQNITGISEEDMAAAVSAAAVAEELGSAMQRHGLSFACAHWAQFERTFLTHCFETHTEQKSLPLEFVCTCQIAKRLYPDLPSRAIRAVGGYFGLDLEEMKRSHGHVETTYFIWQKLARELDGLGIKDIGELVEWLKPVPKVKPASKSKARSVGSFESGKYLLPMERLKRLELPAQPGVYRMLNARGKILYVGKATSLKSRVNSYFVGRRKDSKTKELISQVFDLDVSPLATPLEAALMENDLIKLHDPPYNRALKKRGRGLVYFNHDFTSWAETADAVHGNGPFPRGSTIEPLILLAEGIKTKSFDIGLFWGLLDQEATDKAVQLFLQEYMPATFAGGDAPSVRNLLALGLSLYRRDLLDSVTLSGADLTLAYFFGPQMPDDEEELETVQTDVTGKPEEVEDDDDEEEELTDEELVLMVRGLVTGAARAYISSRTLLRLLDATISFEEKKRRRKLVFAAGQLLSSEDLSSREESKSGKSSSFKPTCRGAVATPVDLITYDRMRVLMAEIRRVSIKGNLISLTEPEVVIS